MYQDEYKRWLAADLEDADLKPELARIEGNDDEIKDRFAVALKFGTAGLRGVLGAGTNRMNIYVVRQATQGLANWVKTQGGNQTVAISYDSRLKSDVFAKTAAGVLAANGIKVRIYDALMPVPALSFATRYYECNAGIMVTASHNPAKYNGYKAYGPDGCQMTDEAADIVYAEIQKTDILTGAKLISFEDGMAQGLIEYVGDDCINALYAAIEARSIRPGICKTAGLKLVYSPLNGSGLVPVTHVLGDIGITDITIVPEQKDPDGNFPTCPYPNPEIFEALRLGLELAEKSGADLMLATDPDADRVGIAVKCKDGSYELLSGNEVGVLLLDYICKMRAERGEDLSNKVAVTTIVSSAMVDALAEHFADMGITKVVGPEARGFMVGVPVAVALGAGFVPARKPGKLPRKTVSESYELEYGTDSIEIHADAISSKDTVLILDDLVATGGTVEATGKLVRDMGAKLVGYGCILELAFLNPRKKLTPSNEDIELFSLVTVD